MKEACKQEYILITRDSVSYHTMTGKRSQARKIMLFWTEDLPSVVIYEVTFSYTGNGMIPPPLGIYKTNI